MKAFTIQEAIELLYGSASIADGETFGATFTRRTDGKLRNGSFRIKVRKGINGVGLSYDPAKKDLFNCFDMNKGFRMIPLGGIHELRIDGVTHRPF